MGIIRRSGPAKRRLIRISSQGENLIKDMKVGQSGYAVPWALEFDTHNRMWLDLNYTIHSKPCGTVCMPVRRVSDAMSGYEVSTSFSFFGAAYDGWEKRQLSHASLEYCTCLDSIGTSLDFYLLGNEKGFMKHFSTALGELGQEEVIRELIGLDLDRRQEGIDEKLEEQFQPLLEKVGAQYVEEETNAG